MITHPGFYYYFHWLAKIQFSVPGRFFCFFVVVVVALKD